MILQFCSFSSGSSGNCYLIKAGETAVLVDAGISGSRILDGLARTHTEPASVKGLFITHEHSDHVSGVAGAMRKLPNLILHANEDTLANMRVSVDQRRIRQFLTGDSLHVGNIEVGTFSLNHDAADPVGYTFSAAGKMVAIVTDTGVFTDEILSRTADADVLVIEANHDLNMLKNGRYPHFLKQRILGDHGHLSNEAAGEAILRLMAMDRKPRCILLGHLSRDNNDPRLAEQTVAAILQEMDYYSGRDLYLKPILRDRLSRIFEI
jgi:phosphoribosyl 1,2-cyclic phosphodiesterase